MLPLEELFKAIFEIDLYIDTTWSVDITEFKVSEAACYCISEENGTTVS